jgi:hypothetical protein
VPGNRPSGKICALELAILRALCAIPNVHRKWAALARQLADHRWQEPDHAVVYEALRRVRGRYSMTWRNQLPAQATRMGFPDIDWPNYLEFEGNSSAELEHLVRQLRALTMRKV